MRALSLRRRRSFPVLLLRRRRRLLLLLLLRFGFLLLPVALSGGERGSVLKKREMTND